MYTCKCLDKLTNAYIHIGIYLLRFRGVKTTMNIDVLIYQVWVYDIGYGIVCDMSTVIHLMYNKCTYRILTYNGLHVHIVALEYTTVSIA